MNSYVTVKKTEKFSPIAVSVLGGVLHNVGQIIAACLWTATPEIIYYLPVLLISGIAAGVIIGLVGGMLINRLEKIKY